MSKLLKQIKNTGSLTLAKMLQPLFGILLIKLISGKMGLDVHGDYSTLLAYIIIFELIAAFGFKRLMTREVAKDLANAQNYFTNAIVIVIPIALAATAILFGITSGWKPELMQAVWILGASLIATSVVQSSEGVLVGFERMHLVGIVWTVENFLRVTISLILVYMGFGLRSLMLTYTVLRFCSLAFYLIYIFKFLGSSKSKIDPALIKSLFKSAWIFALTVVFVAIYWKVDMLMLKHMKGESAVGIYDGAYRFFAVILILISNFVFSVFPAFSSFFKDSAEQFQKIVRKTFKYFILLATPFVILLYFYSHFLVKLVFDATKYADSVQVLHILALAVIPYGITEIFAHMLLASNKQKIDLMINGIGMLINVGLNLILIPKYSYFGAAAATYIAIHLYILMQVAYLRRQKIPIRVPGYINQAIRFFISTLFAIGYVIVCSRINLRFLAALTPVLFFVMIWKLKIVAGEDKRLITELFKKVKVFD